MSRRRFELDQHTLEESMRSAGVRAALRSVAEVIAARANAIGAAEGVTVDATVTEGTRPQGRPYAYVESPAVEQEWGTSSTDRRRVLGRAATGG